MSLNRLPSSPYIDMVLSHLRAQIVALDHVRETIERTHRYEDEFIHESVKTVESELRRLRRLIELN